MQFIELVRYAHDNAEKEHIERPLDWAVKEAIRRGILPEYLERKASEVMNMLDMEYDYELDLTTRWEEGHESGLKEGLLKSIQNLMESLKMSDTEAMAVLKIPECERGKYVEMMGQH